MAGAADPDYIAELFAAFGRVSVRRMFSGAGVFADGLMIGLISRGVIYLKADPVTIPAFEHEGLGPFTYQTKNGQRSLMSYWRMPERLYDEPDELAQWAASALEAARRTAPRKSATGKSAGGKSASGKSASGKSASGKSASGKSASGKSASGKSASGRAPTASKRKQRRRKRS